ncbi:MAG: GntR family transcriptional regulator [Pygmaiobacter massiliensis]|nr:GntR family transcriptional regulator [Pygmaiobacter massiliensis]
MELILSNSSGKPIYEQISQQIKSLILSGELTQGELLPSMRQLAKDLHISVITTKRAYEDLERDGFLVNVPGKGCFVAKANPEFIREEVLRRVQEALSQAVDIAKSANLTQEELWEMLKLLYEGEA